MVCPRVSYELSNNVAVLQNVGSNTCTISMQEMKIRRLLCSPEDVGAANIQENISIDFFATVSPRLIRL